MSVALDSKSATKMEDIAAFAAVVRCKSISLAAKALKLTQPAISRRIQSFEESLGTPLLDRNSKPLLPTPLGKLIYEQCLVVLREVQTMRELAASDPLPSGGLRMGVVQTVGDIALLDALQHLKTEFPELTTEVRTSWASDLLASLRKGEIDAATVLFPAAKIFPEGIAAKPLAKVSLAVVARKGDYPKSAYRLAEIAERGWILNPDGCGFRATLAQVLSSEGGTLKVNLETSGTELQLDLVAGGHGLGLMPLPLLQRSARFRQLQVVPIRDFKPALNVWLLHSPRLGRLQAPTDAFGKRVTAAFDAKTLASRANT